MRGDDPEYDAAYDLMVQSCTAMIQATKAYDDATDAFFHVRQDKYGFNDTPNYVLARWKEAERAKR